MGMGKCNIYVTPQALNLHDIHMDLVCICEFKIHGRICMKVEHIHEFGELHNVDSICYKRNE